MEDKRKEVLISLMHDPLYRPMKLKELCILLDVPKERREELKEVLDELVLEGRIGLSPRGKYGKPELYTLVGDYHANPRGFGFVTAEGREQDIFIPPDFTGGALDGDRVRVNLEKDVPGKRAEGRVVRILNHAITEVVGIYRQNKHYGFVIPDNQKILQDIFIPEGKAEDAKNGEKVIARLTNYGNAKSNPEGVITEVLGSFDAPGVDIRSVIRSFGLSEQFPKEVLDCLSDIPDAVAMDKATHRLDLRGEQMVTIDGEDAKDLDDAVSLTFNDETGLYRLGVHIADVSEYVKENSPLDEEAKTRGTSVYFPDRVLPMLPKKLSNGICSLNQQEDRLALSCIMYIDRAGKIVDHQIAETLICVDRRMSYKNVNAIITKNDARMKEQYAAFVPMLLQMKTLSGLLRARRRKRGGIDFDFPESKIKLDAKGKVISVEPYEINDANRLIEDFMLAANETVAEEFYWREIPFLYRTHEPPSEDKALALSLFVNRFGFILRPGKDGSIYPKQIQELLAKIDGSEAAPLIERVALRSMRQARYTTECTGHFGLAAKYYTHFTSPIRRYPDLQIHRIIKENLRGGLGAKHLAHYESILPGVADSSSKAERRADEAERDCEKMKKCEYMRRFIGETFDGVISGVTAFGFYVELPNTCEGMVHVTTLTDDYYVYDEKAMELRGEHTFRSYAPGQKVRIMVTGADKLMRTVDFRVLPETNEKEPI